MGFHWRHEEEPAAELCPASEFNSRGASDKVHPEAAVKLKSSNRHRSPVHHVEDDFEQNRKPFDPFPRLKLHDYCLLRYMHSCVHKKGNFILRNSYNGNI